MTSSKLTLTDKLFSIEIVTKTYLELIPYLNIKADMIEVRSAVL